jgi:hypothetical protein
MSNWIYFTIAMLCVFGGIALIGAQLFVWLKLRKYEFDHKSVGGIVEFPSYFAATRHQFFKRFHVVLGIAGLILMGVGVFVGIQGPRGKLTETASASSKAHGKSHAS